MMPRFARTMSGVATLLACTPATPPIEAAAPVAMATSLPGTTIRGDDTRWIRGRIVGHDGAPPTFAAITLARFDRHAVEDPFVIDEHGEFAIESPADADLVELRIGATDHTALSLPIDAREPEVRLDILLGTPERVEGDVQALVTTARVDADPWGSGGLQNDTMLPPIAMRRGPDGVFTGEAPTSAPGVLFVLMSGGTSMHPLVMPAGQAAYVPSGGLLWAYAPAQAGRVALRVDLSRWTGPRTMPRVLVGDTARASSALVRARMAALAWGLPDPGAPSDGLPPADRASCPRAAEAARTDDPATWVHYAAFAAARGCEIAAADARAALQSIAVDDPRWALAPGALAATTKAAKDEAYEAALIDRHPNARLVGDLLVAQLEAAEADKPRARALVARLRDRRFSHTMAQAMAIMLDPDRLDAGMPTPEFSVPALDGGPPVTRAGLLGRPHVLEFWGTWCGPCVEALPKLHAAYAELHGVAAPAEAAGWQGLALPGTPAVEFVSISVHEPATRVTAFRRERWTMPWLHAVADAASQQVMDSFGVAGVPTLFFVDAAGVLVQRDGDLAAGIRKLKRGR